MQLQQDMAAFDGADPQQGHYVAVRVHVHVCVKLALNCRLGIHMLTDVHSVCVCMCMHDICLHALLPAHTLKHSVLHAHT